MLKHIALALAIAALSAVAPGSQPERMKLAWLSGDWRALEGARWTEERWSAARGGVMLGTSLTGKGGKAEGYEFLRIAAGDDGQPAYYASPGGAPAVAFRLVSSGPDHAVFENPAHDFPQRISYRREGDVLVATVSDIRGANAQRWRFEKASTSS